MGWRLLERLDALLVAIHSRLELVDAVHQCPCLGRGRRRMRCRIPQCGFESEMNFVISQAQGAISVSPFSRTVCQRSQSARCLRGPLVYELAVRFAFYRSGRRRTVSCHHADQGRSQQQHQPEQKNPLMSSHDFENAFRLRLSRKGNLHSLVVATWRKCAALP